ncbi:MAG TPA: UDP-N-acetylglucosamine 2-epimerase (non-hydrolyzing), partial [Thermococcus sp.]|nr:UDP-N-acetylglucosamine 2-epimerase (non-hydrolyzing) [Thermococcus sp.]
QEEGEFYRKMAEAPNPFGDGKAGERIAEILLELYEKGELKVRSSRFI